MAVWEHCWIHANSIMHTTEQGNYMIYIVDTKLNNGRMNNLIMKMAFLTNCETLNEKTVIK